jgi:putative tricarboxylic transport membrane protein
MIHSSMTPRRALFSGAAVAFAAALALPGTAVAQDKKPPRCEIMEVISHASPGGGTDTTARMMMIRTRRELIRANYTNDIIVVYKRGGGAANAHEYLKSRPADGCTVAAMTQTHLYTIARGKSPLTIDDFQGVARAMEDSTFIVVRKDSPFQTIDQLYEESKKRPLNWGVANIGGTEHVGLIRWANAAGIKYKVVPFGSGGKMLNALLSGAIDATLPNVSEAVGQIEDGTIRPLVVMSDKRLSDYPDVPSAFEKGWKVKVNTTRGYAVKAGTPPEAVAALEKAMTKAMRHEVFANYLKSAGLNPKTSVAGVEQWNKNLREEYEIAYEAVTKLGLDK